jgi:hypothetical protein
MSESRINSHFPVLIRIIRFDQHVSASSFFRRVSVPLQAWSADADDMDWTDWHGQTLAKSAFSHVHLCPSVASLLKFRRLHLPQRFSARS